MNNFSFLTTHFTQQNYLWSHQNLSAILCSLGCNEPYLPIAEMPTCGDLKSRDFFLDQHIPPHVTPLQKILFQSGPHTPPPPPSNSAGKTWIYLSGTSISWIFIQSNSCLYRCNKEKTLFFLFATTTAQLCITLENDARNHNESIRSQMIGSVSGKVGIYATAFSRKERLYKSCIFHSKIGCILRVLPVNQVLNDSVTIHNRVNWLNLKILPRQNEMPFQ